MEPPNLECRLINGAFTVGAQKGTLGNWTAAGMHRLHCSVIDKTLLQFKCDVIYRLLPKRTAVGLLVTQALSVLFVWKAGLQ